MHLSVQHHGSPRKTGRVLFSDVLFEAGAQMTICLDGAMTKNGHPWEAIVPDMVSEKLGHSDRTIAGGLNADGIPTESGKRSGIWGASTISGN